jgi:hypothetical protein
MRQTSDKGIEYHEKPVNGLRKLSAIFTVLGYLSFFGGFYLGYVLWEEYYSDSPFFLGIAAGFVSGISYLFIANMTKLLIGVKENLDEMVNNTRLITAQLERTNLKE